MNRITILTVFTVCFMCIVFTPVAVAEDIQGLEQAIAELNKKYGITESPTLTDEQWAEYDKRAQAINDEYSDIFDELDKKIAEIDAEFGIPPWPQLSEEQWNAYDKEIEAIFDMAFDIENTNDTSVYGESEYDQRLAALYKKYGIPEPVNLTDEQWIEYDKRVDAINDEYIDIIRNLEREIAQVDAKYNINSNEPLPDQYVPSMGSNISEDQWNEYNNEIQAIYAKYDKDLRERDAKFVALDKEFGILEYPELTEEQWNAYDKEFKALHAEINLQTDSSYGMNSELEAKFKAINKKYGIPNDPINLTEEQWAEYDKRVQAVYAQYDDMFAELDTKFLALDKEFGIDSVVLSPDDWETYDREMSALFAKFDVDQTFGATSGSQDGVAPTDISSEIEYEKQMRSVFSSFGFIAFEELDDLPSSFWRGIEDIDTKYIDHLNLIGDPYAIENKTGSYEILSSEYLPAVSKLCGEIECVPLLTPSQIEDLDEQLSEIQKKFDNGEL